MPKVLGLNSLHVLPGFRLRKEAQRFCISKAVSLLGSAYADENAQAFKQVDIL
jgi:hypothetical protein